MWAIRNKNIISNSEGSASVEAGLTLTTVILLMVSMIDLGLVFVQYHGLNEGARRSLRWAAVNEYDPAKIKNVAIYGNPDGVGDRLLPLDASAVNVSITAVSSSTAILSISLENPAYTALSPWVGIGPFAPRVEASQMAENLGVMP